jgi:hypothetical protein
MSDQWSLIDWSPNFELWANRHGLASAIAQETHRIVLYNIYSTAELHNAPLHS